MKKLLVLSTMISSLVLAAAVAFGAGQLTLPIAWYVNDANGEFRVGDDTWFVLKNNANDFVTLTLDYYDDSDVTSIATTDTVVLDPQGFGFVYTGQVATSINYSFVGPGYGLGAGGDRGSVIIRWDNTTGATKARQVITGYQTIENFDAGSSFGINFSYTDD